MILHSAAAVTVKGNWPTTFSLRAGPMSFFESFEAVLAYLAFALQQPAQVLPPLLIRGPFLAIFDYFRPFG